MRSLAIVALLSGTAAAGKPTEAQAKKAATDWVAAMHFGGEAKLEAAVALTASPLFAAAYDDEHDLCPAGMATTAGAIAKALACLHDKVEPKGKPKVTRKSGANLGGPLAQQAKKLTELKKTMVVIELDDGCEGNEHQLLVAVTTDKKKVARVAAVLYQAVTCGE